MAGFFGFFDYTKEGPGVPENAPAKARPIVFFEILLRKFWSLMKINIMFFLFNLPALAVVLFISPSVFSGSLHENVSIDLMVKFILGIILLCVPIITVGPAQAGFTYILRNYAREEHAFIWWDFKDYAKKNFKQSTIVSIVDLLFTLVIFNAFVFYTNYATGILAVVGRVIIIVAFVLFMMMHLYIYPMMVTFKLTIKQIYKNALLFSLIKLVPNIGILILIAVICYGSFLIPYLGLFMLPLLTLSIIGLLNNFYVFPILKKYMIDITEEPAINPVDSKENKELESGE